MIPHHTLRLAFVVLSGALIASAASASPAPSAAFRSNNPPPTAAVRGYDELGVEVFSADGVRIGTVHDYVLQFENTPQLRYVIVKSGGFLGLGGDRRAIPADAIALVDHRIRVNMPASDYEQLPALPGNAHAFFSSVENRDNLAKRCGTAADRADLKSDYLLFSDLGPLSTIVDKNGEPLGYFSDIWIDFNANEAPYLEFDPIEGPIDTVGNIEYDVPTTAITSIKTGEVHLAMGGTEFDHLKEIDDAPAYVASAGEKLEAALPAK